MAKNKKSHPNWHPDFRIAEELPDIKPIRTDFLVNGITWAIVLFLLAAIAQREISALTLGSRVKEVRMEISNLEASNQAALALANEFTTLLPVVEDIERFHAAPVEPTDFVLEILQTAPASIEFASLGADTEITIDRANTILSYSFRVSGSARALTEVETFKERIAALPSLSAFRGTINEGRALRDPLTGRFNFELQIKFLPDFK